MRIDVYPDEESGKLNVRYAVEAVEDEITHQIGPFGKFIVNKCLVEMGHSRHDDLTLEELIEFINRVTKMAIADENVRKGIVDKITMKLEIKINIKSDE